MSVNSLLPSCILWLLWGCQEPAPAPPSEPPVSRPPPVVPRVVEAPQLLLWKEASLQSETAGLLQKGQVVFVEDRGPEVSFQGQTATLVHVRAYGLSGWALENQLHPLELPAWGLSLSGNLNPPSTTCVDPPPPPQAGQSYRLLQPDGERVAFEFPCIQSAEPGQAETKTHVEGSASLLAFRLIPSPNRPPPAPPPEAPATVTVSPDACTTRLRALGRPDPVLASRLPTDPATCAQLVLERIDVPKAYGKVYRFGIPDTAIPAAGFIQNGAFLAEPAWQSQVFYTGPDYLLLADTTHAGRIRILRMGFGPANLMVVLDQPGTELHTDKYGHLRGSLNCDWLPGRKQYFRCRN